MTNIGTISVLYSIFGGKITRENCYLLQTNIEPVWQPEEIVPPEGRKRSDTLAGVPEPDLHIQTLYPGIMENGENITLDLHHSDSCGNACHVNMVFDESEEDLYLSTRTKNDRSLSSVW